MTPRKSEEINKVIRPLIIDALEAETFGALSKILLKNPDVILEPEEPLLRKGETK